MVINDLAVGGGSEGGLTGLIDTALIRDTWKTGWTFMFRRRESFTAEGLMIFEMVNGPKKQGVWGILLTRECPCFLGSGCISTSDEENSPFSFKKTFWASGDKQNHRGESGER